MRKVTIYRDDSTTQVVIKKVKHFFFTANNTVLTIAVVDDVQSGAHHYIHWPISRVCWFKDEPDDSTDYADLIHKAMGSEK